MQKILMGIVAAVAVAGWITAFYALKSSGEVEERLTAAKAELSAVSEKLTGTQNRLRLQRDAAGSLEEIGERIGSVQAEAATLTRQIKTKTSELQALQQKTATGKTGLASVARQVEAKKSALASLTQDVEAAKAELGRLRAESERQREAVTRVPVEKQTAVPALDAPTTSLTAAVTPEAATEATTAAATPVVNPLADARRRFARIDQDGDGRFDRLDFRLKRVSLFGLVDANEDDYLTLDETLLSPEEFQFFDSDGDGKISSLEMADRRSFSVIDADRDEFVTFEEYVKFLRIGPE